MCEFRYQRHSVKCKLGLSLFDQRHPTGQKLLSCPTTSCWRFTCSLFSLYLPRKHTLDYCVWRMSLAEVNWGWRIPQKPGYTQTHVSLTTAGRPDLNLPPVRHSPHHALLGCRVRRRSMWQDKTWGALHCCHYQLYTATQTSKTHQ